MDIESYRNYCLLKKGVTESFPFHRLPNLLVFKVANKMFTATDIITFESISVRCKRENTDEFRAKYQSITEHFYFKKGWNLIKMDNSIQDKLILEWIDTSYNLAITKLTKNIRAKLK